MIIHPVERTTAGGWVTLSARLEFDKPRFNRDEPLYFSVPEQFADMLVDRHEVFVTAMLPYAIVLNEPINVRGDLSPRFLYGMEKLIAAYHEFLPDIHHVIRIHPDGMTETQRDPARRGVLSMFSGGLDSMYTLWSHLPEQQTLPNFQITHAIFAEGIDLLRYQNHIYQRCLDAYEPLLAKSGVELISLKTNLVDFMPIYWGSGGKFGYGVGPLYAGFGMMLGTEIATVYVPASFNFRQNTTSKWGSHPSIDYHAATETLETFHDGTERSRGEKLQAVVEWQGALSVLRVCVQSANIVREFNCCRCYKCIATMIRLDVLGQLNAATAFPKPLHRWHRYKLALSGRFADARFWGDTLPLARQQRRWGLLFDLTLMRLILPTQRTLRRRLKSLRNP